MAYREPISLKSSQFLDIQGLIYVALFGIKPYLYLDFKAIITGYQDKNSG